MAGAVQAILLSFSAAAAAIGAPVFIGASVLASGSTTTQAKTTTSAAPVGSVVLVATQISSGGTTNITGVSDGTNTYTKVNSVNGLDEETTLWATGTLTNQLASGTNIIATSSTAGNRAFISIAYVTGLSSGSVDKTATTSWGGVTSGAVSTGTLVQANEIVIGVLSGRGPATLTQDAGFTTIDNANNQWSANDMSYMWGYKTVAATTSITFNPTASATFYGGGTLVGSFKGS